MIHTDRRTKIICTIGPATESASTIEELIRAGMNLARLNFSHGTHQEQAERIRTIREVSAALNIPVAITAGPARPQDPHRAAEVTGGHPQGGQPLRAHHPPGRRGRTRRQHHVRGLPESVNPCDVIFLNDGAIKLEVIGTSATDVTCRVVVGGVLESGKGINAPGVNLRVPSPMDTDRDDLLFGIEHGVDFVALSFVRAVNDVLAAKSFLQDRGADIPLIAKIEKWEAWRDIDRIIAAADGLMVARGDLGVEIPLEKVPLVQKEMIRKCNRAGKPVITATQMLESMIDSPLPTRAEVTDIANSIIDGTDAIMLSGETAVGRYPVEAVRVMTRVALETEASLDYDRIVADKGADLEPVTDDAISYAACHHRPPAGGGGHRGLHHVRQHRQAGGQVPSGYPHPGGHSQPQRRGCGCFSPGASTPSRCPIRAPCRTSLLKPSGCAGRPASPAMATWWW